MLDPTTFSLPSGESVKCGLRTELPKKERRHKFLDAGMERRYSGDGWFQLRIVLICSECGTEKIKKPTWTVSLPRR